MKSTVFTLLLIFVSFIAFPTILSKAYGHIDTSVFYNLAEEEEERHGVEIYEVLEEKLTKYDFWSLNSNSKINSKYIKRYDDVSREIGRASCRERVIV